MKSALIPRMLVIGQTSLTEMIEKTIQSFRILESLGTVSTTEEAMEWCRKFRPAVLVIVADSRQVDAVATMTRDIDGEKLPTEVVVMTLVDAEIQRFVITSLARSGAAAVIHLKDSHTEWEGILSVVLNGGTGHSATVRHALMMDSGSLFKIDDEQKAVLRCLRKGMSNKEIATKLNLKEKRVERILKELSAIFRVQDRTALAVQAVERGVL